MKNLKYGDNYPKQCPPKDAKEVTGYYFRLCIHHKMCTDDFKTQVDLNLPFPSKVLCEAKALSFCTNKKATQRIKDKYPRFKGYSIYKIYINENWGVAELRGSHLNLWQYKGVDYLKEAQQNSQRVE